MPSAPPYQRRLDKSPSDDSPKKRKKGATRLSCAECRRLKLRCDRAIPCGSCVKRGCGPICPDGSLTTGQGNRFVLASTQELHEKISELANRVRELEDGLRTSHAQTSTEQHPLLAEELLKIKAPLQRDVSQKPLNVPPIKEENNPDVVDAFGSLSISLSGRAKYFGQIANSWVGDYRSSNHEQLLNLLTKKLFLQNELPEEGEHDNHLANLQRILPPDILKRAASFPVSVLSQTENVGLQTLYWYLPPSDVARELCAIYYSHASWMYNPIGAEAFDKEIFSQFYNQNIGSIVDDPLVAHRLSLLFLVLAIGSLMNTSLPAYNPEAEKYHQLARAALFHYSLFDEPTINAIQALYLMTYYLFLADRHGTDSGARWTTMGIAVKLGQSIGLHRDSGKWKVDPIETQRRRELFWELFTYDSWQCLTFGRPPSFALPHFDCKMPYTSDVTDEQSFHAWKHRFASECMTLLHDQAFGAKMPTYATVLQLDRKLRAFPVPPILQVAGFGSSEPRQGGYPETVMLTLQRHIVLAIREMNLLYLHRSFFARAISDHPKDPLGSPYGTSVIAAYRSAGSLVAMMRNLHTQLKEPSERIWFLWTHMFSCAIVLGSIVTRCPSMSLAPSALVQLDSACELFSKAARGFRATKVLNIMLQLQEKAHLSLEEFKRGKVPPPSRYNSGEMATTPDAENDELSVLGGKTRLVSKQGPLSPMLSPRTENPIVPLPLSPDSRGQLPLDVLEYLATFSSHQIQAQPATSHSNSFSSDGPSSSPSSASFSQADLSPVQSMYGMSTLPPQNFHSEPSTFMNQQQQLEQQQALREMMSNTRNDLQSHQPMSNQLSRLETTFPAYFPVYDYTAVPHQTSANGYGVMLDSSPHPGQRRASGSPDGTMHSTWQDFVTNLAMQ